MYVTCPWPELSIALRTSDMIVVDLQGIADKSLRTVDINNN